VGMCSVIGLPPTAGFISKWIFLLGALDAGKIPFVIVVLVSSLLKAGYFFPIVIKAFFGKPEEGAPQGMQEAPWPVLAPLVFTAAASLFLFFYPQPFFDLAAAAAKHLFQG
jgi:multicomponent Na+:H+ antiporter subunit D